MRTGNFPSVVAALLVLFCFFLPWVSVSCSGQNVIELTGFDLAAGKEMNLGFGSERTDSDPLLFAIPAASVLALLLGVSAKVGSRSPAVVQLTAALTAMAVLLVRGWEMYEGAMQNRNGILTLDAEIGLWGTAAGLLMLIVTAAGVTLSRKTTPPAQQLVPTLPRGPAGWSPEPAQGTLVCPACQAALPHPVKFCPKCGARQVGSNVPS